MPAGSCGHVGVPADGANAVFAGDAGTAWAACSPGGSRCATITCGVVDSSIDASADGCVAALPTAAEASWPKHRRLHAAVGVR